MKAIILAAGKGERLYEITRNTPKPMVRIGGKPVLEQNIEWLLSYGIKDIYINLHHLSDDIRNYFRDGSDWGIKITYSYEPELLGTAGAVRKIADECWGGNTKNQPFLVIYGDNLFEYDLQEIINFHRRKKGVATIALYEKDDVSQVGIALLNKEGRVTKFVEKPGPEEIFSHLVNTGIYVLEAKVLDYIPSGKTVDFGRDLFPEMLKHSETIFGIIVTGKLTAIDTPELLKEALRATNIN